jgi:hypothetical protein
MYPGEGGLNNVLMVVDGAAPAFELKGRFIQVLNTPYSRYNESAQSRAVEFRRLPCPVTFRADFCRLQTCTLTSTMSTDHLSALLVIA